MSDTTINYYDNNADKFVSDTQDVVFTETQDLFLSYLKKDDNILDFGCGSGRDSKYFLNKGFLVTATDGSVEMCKAASAYAGINVKHLLFNELEDKNCYDGVWACSSILHLNRELLIDSFHRIARSLKENGILYASFKYSEFEGLRNGRYFIDFTSESFHDFMIDIPEFTIEKEWVTGDVRPGRENDKWLNLIMRNK